jgi:hypothetical protein
MAAGMPLLPLMRLLGGPHQNFDALRHRDCGLLATESVLARAVLLGR